MPRPIKILHVFGRMELGGAELRTLDIMKNIDPNRYKLHFVALSGLPGKLDTEIVRLGGMVHLLPLGYGFAQRFKALLSDLQPDVVHSHVHHPSGYLLLLAAQEQIPVRVTHFRNTTDDRGNSILRRLRRAVLKHWIDRHATHILAVSKGSMKAAWRPYWQHDQRCKVIYNGLDPCLFTQPPRLAEVRNEFHIPTDAQLYIHVGRMDPAKNHTRLLDIFATIAEMNPQAWLMLVGRGTDDVVANLKHQAQRLKIGKRVRFIGERNDVVRLIKAANVMLFPSLWEGLPGAVLEACACGTPVLSSNLSGSQEIGAYFPTVRCLDLSAADSEWALAALQLSQLSAREHVRDTISALFLQSPFVVDKCAEAVCAIWDHAVPSLKDTPLTSL